MFHTHAPLPWGFFGRSMADANEDSGHLGSDQLIKMPETKIQSVTIHKLKTTWSRDSLVILIRKVRWEVVWIGASGQNIGSRCQMTAKLGEFRRGEKTKVTLRRILGRNLKQFKDRGIQLTIPNQSIVQDVCQLADLHGHRWDLVCSFRRNFHVGSVVRIVICWCITRWVFRDAIVLLLLMRKCMELLQYGSGGASNWQFWRLHAIHSWNSPTCPSHDPQFHARKIPLDEGVPFHVNQSRESRVVFVCLGLRLHQSVWTPGYAPLVGLVGDHLWMDCVERTGSTSHHSLA